MVSPRLALVAGVALLSVIAADCDRQRAKELPPHELAGVWNLVRRHDVRTRRQTGEHVGDPTYIDARRKNINVVVVFRFLFFSYSYRYIR